MNDTRFTTDLIANPSPLNGLPGRRKIALVGFTDRVHKQAPYDDPTWEIWGFNMANRMDFMKDREGRFRADRWFDLHPLAVQSVEDLAWIAQCPVPLYLTEPYPGNPLARTYPLFDVDMWAKLRLGRSLPFASSFAYAIALAIMEGYEEIGLFGCELDWGRERVVEHGNLELWAGVAMGLDITITVPQGSAILSHPALYGFDYHAEKEAVEARMVRLMFELYQYDTIRAQYKAFCERWNMGEDEACRVREELWGKMLMVKEDGVVL